MTEQKQAPPRYITVKQLRAEDLKFPMVLRVGGSPEWELVGISAEEDITGAVKAEYGEEWPNWFVGISREVHDGTNPDYVFLTTLGPGEGDDVRHTVRTFHRYDLVDVQMLDSDI